MSTLVMDFDTAVQSLPPKLAFREEEKLYVYLGNMVASELSYESVTAANKPSAIVSPIVASKSGRRVHDSEFLFD
ncbi:uncharacterized protein RCO7_14136 [Rhynchosporium graminicola]|uniref:Uncharacterized protein n=1 Tax=Rhynchosporium graminicola TaxID=2792576 RepID=A0A1E1JSQ8_9HELO|nr:uncharacterized protein RCO7_14136 [Rhynchosporium commune]